MTDQERIAALERELVELRSRFQQHGAEHQYQLGMAYGFYAAIRALIESHHSHDYLFPAIAHAYQQADAFANAEVANEQFPQGLQDAHMQISAALDILHKRQDKT